MTHTVRSRRLVGFVVGLREHVFLVSIGITLMMVGLGLGVTMSTPTAGIVIGVVGCAMFAAGMSVRMDHV